MSVTADQFRAMLGRFATGVTILTVRDAAGKDHGMTVSAFSSVSLDPPMVLACISREAEMFRVLPAAAHFGISVLTTGQEAISRRFAELTEGRFDGIEVSRGTHGVALINGALGYLECKRVTWHVAGDHAICIGEVVRTQEGAAGAEPLVYYRGAYTRLGR